MYAYSVGLESSFVFVIRTTDLTPGLLQLVVLFSDLRPRNPVESTLDMLGPLAKALGVDTRIRARGAFSPNDERGQRGHTFNET